MKLEGMDAALRVAAAQTRSIDQARVDSTQAHGKRRQPAENGEQAGAAGNAAVKVRLPSEPQAYEKVIQGQDGGEAEKAIAEAIERANRAILGSDRKFEITVHEKTKDIMVKVVDTTTNETIREIPPKKIVDLVVRLCEIAGILYDEMG